MDVVALLRTMIKQRGVTYTFICRCTGIPLDAFSRTMRGKRRLRAEELVAVCSLLHIDMGAFAGLQSESKAAV